MRVKTVLLFLVACLVVVPIIGCSGEKMSLEYRLMLACGSGDVDAVNDLLEQGASANGGEDMEGVPLFAALSEGNLAIADILVDSGADIDVLFDGESLPDLFKNEKDDSDDEVEREKLQSAIDWLNARGARPPP
ncbi:MAG: hypothetical protein IH944_11100 [Armatimonadetes bacterium]|nr:hypothetical protein [Armatimonadota bacterium]